MRNDALSEVLELIDVQGVMTGGFTASGPWVARGELTRPLEFVVVARGRALFETNSTAEPVEVTTGDVVVLNRQTWLRGRGGASDEVPREIDVTRPGEFSPHDSDAVIGGHLHFNALGHVLLHALPDVSVVRGSSLPARIDHLVEEFTSDRIGAAFAVRQHAQLLVLDVLRAHLGRADLPAGLLRLLTDARLLPAVTLIHTRPGHPWQLGELATAAAMSRTTFATRFRAVAGVPPLTYLCRWRMLLAERALRDTDARVGELAASLGFGSESAFCTAFKREVGESPLRFRTRARLLGALEHDG
ncbi:AraC family transcriptional regulator [Lentzea sp. JNUCC 0626]|uniref:helix-turn-helix transcriptional regulator n=1 Tax=Lentzea sp. JNUCC 0626 TaxID=3367513 RepID=UPI003748A3C6